MNRIVTFRVGDSWHGLPAELVQQVVEQGPVMSSMPGGGERRLDLMRVKGRWLPIVSLGGEAPEADERPESMLMVLGRGERRVGLLVDELGEVTSVGESESGRRGEGVVDVAGELVRLIDPETMLARSGTLFEEGEDSMEESGLSAELRRVVAFGVGGEEFGLDVMNVLEVLKIPEVREVPNAPEFVEGVVDVRDSVVPIIDLRIRFSVSGEKRAVDERLVVSEGAHGRVALVVDDVAGVVSIPEESISSPPEFFKGLAGRYLKGVARSDDRLIILLDIDEILSSQERIALQQMQEPTGDREAASEHSGSGSRAASKRAVGRKASSDRKGKRSTGKTKGGVKKGGVKKGRSRRKKGEE